MTNIIGNDITIPSIRSGASNIINRIVSCGKRGKVWHKGNVFTLRKKPNFLLSDEVCVLGLL